MFKYLYEHQVKKLWVLNVGDIKPGEIGTEFFLKMAWNAEHWKNRDSKELNFSRRYREYCKKLNINPIQ